MSKQRTGCVSSPPPQKNEALPKKNGVLFSPAHLRKRFYHFVVPWRRKSSGQVRVKAVHKKQSGVFSDDLSCFTTGGTAFNAFNFFGPSAPLDNEQSSFTFGQSSSSPFLPAESSFFPAPFCSPSFNPFPATPAFGAPSFAPTLSLNLDPKEKEAPPLVYVALRSYSWCNPPLRFGAESLLDQFSLPSGEKEPEGPFALPQAFAAAPSAMPTFGAPSSLGERHGVLLFL